MRRARRIAAPKVKLTDQQRAVVQNLGVVLRAHPLALVSALSELVEYQSIDFESAMRCIILYWLWCHASGTTDIPPADERKSPFIRSVVGPVRWIDIRHAVLQHFYLDPEKNAMHHRILEDDLPADDDYEDGY